MNLFDSAQFFFTDPDPDSDLANSDPDLDLDSIQVFGSDPDLQKDPSDPICAEHYHKWGSSKAEQNHQST